MIVCTSFVSICKLACSCSLCSCASFPTLARLGTSSFSLRDLRGRISSIFARGPIFYVVSQEADALNVTDLWGTTTELPDDEKLTFLAPEDFGWSTELQQSPEPVQV